MRAKPRIWGRCYCGRIWSVVRTIEGRNGQEMGPFCPQNVDARKQCKPLSSEERASPGIRGWYTRCDFSKLDDGIREVIRYLRTYAVDTISSCDGHFEHAPYIYFYDAEDRARAQYLLEYLGPRAEELRGPQIILGTVYALTFPSVFAAVLKARGAV